MARSSSHGTVDRGDSKPHLAWARPYGVAMARPPRSNLHPIVAVIASNIKTAVKQLGSNQAEVERRSKGQISQRTVSHAASGKVAQQADTIARIAEALGLEPWQLLVPDLDPRHPPMVGDTPGARKLPSDDLLALLLEAWGRMDRDARFRLVEAARRSLKVPRGGTDPPPALAPAPGLSELPEGPRTAPEPPHAKR